MHGLMADNRRGRPADNLLEARTRSVVSYHERQLAHLEVTEPLGWRVLFLRWRAHTAWPASGANPTA